jgi:hypothetical protein
MTLILSCLTHDYVIQVSEREITHLGTTIRKENKSVLWNGALAFGYTGITPLEGEPTSDWLARTLLEANDITSSFGDRLQFIASSATRAMDKTFRTYRCRYAHAFGAVGWVYVTVVKNNARKLLALDITISNAINNDGSWRKTPAAEFEVRASGYEIDPGSLVIPAPLGQPPTRRNHVALARLLKRGIARGASPDWTASVLESALRRVAKDHATVGDDLLVCCLPRHAFEETARAGNRTIQVQSGPPNLIANTFEYSSPDKRVSYSPVIVIGNRFSDAFADAPPSPDRRGAFDLTAPDAGVIIRTDLGPPPPERRDE